MLGLPTIAVPAGRAAHGPVGVQLVAGRFQEATCLHLAAILERAMPSPTPIEPVSTRASAADGGGEPARAGQRSGGGG
jgi:amidase